jgi:hypothetical protein
MAEHITAEELQVWKDDVKQVTADIKALYNKLENDILYKWEAARDQAGEAGKHEVDALFEELTEAKAELCALKGGGRSQRQRHSQRQRRSHSRNKRTRKHRR